MPVEGGPPDARSGGDTEVGDGVPSVLEENPAGSGENGGPGALDAGVGCR
jgi:hypothetical protein